VLLHIAPRVKPSLYGLRNRKGTRRCPSALEQPQEQSYYRSHLGHEEPEGQSIGRSAPRLPGFELEKCDHCILLLVRGVPYGSRLAHLARRFGGWLQIFALASDGDPPNTLRLRPV
jgi:hypothetical protein